MSLISQSKIPVFKCLTLQNSCKVVDIAKFQTKVIAHCKMFVYIVLHLDIPEKQLSHIAKWPQNLSGKCIPHSKVRLSGILKTADSLKLKNTP